MHILPDVSPQRVGGGPIRPASFERVEPVRDGIVKQQERIELDGHVAVEFIFSEKELERRGG